MSTLNNFTDLFKNLGQMKARAEELQQKMARLHITGEAGAGLVRVTVTGEGTVVSVQIDPALLSPRDKEMLEELMVSAVNEAAKKAREAMAHEMKSLAGGMNIPGMDQMFRS